MLCRVLCVLLFLALTAERAGDPLLYNGTWRSPMALFAPLFDSLPVVRQPAWNVIVAALAPFCLISPGALRRRAWPLDLAILVSLGTLALGVVWGVARGGDAYWAYYQVNSLFWTMFVALMLLCVTRTRRDLQALGMTILAAALLRAVLALYYFFAFVRGTEPYPPHMTNHDDSALFVAGAIVVLSWAIARWRVQAWLLASALLLPLLLAMKVNNRRVAWIELVFVIGFAYMMLPPGRVRRRANAWMLAVVPVVLLYVAVGWGRPGAAFAPLRALDSTTGENQDASSLARNEENLNIVLTYINHPIMGSGWGHQFRLVSSTYAYFGGGFDEMYRYTPHNSLAALTAFSGLVGLLGILGVIPVTAFLGARAVRASTGPVERAAAIGAVCYLPAYGVQAFADLGLQMMTAGMLLSAAMAVAGRVAASSGAWPSDRRARVSHRGGRGGDDEAATRRAGPAAADPLPAPGDPGTRRSGDRGVRRGFRRRGRR